VTSVYHGQSFLVREPVTPGGVARLVATPLLVVLVLIETTDLVFAVDSIPAVFAVTQKPLIVYTSNVFAILCLRAMYFVLAGIIDQFRFLQLGLSVVLAFVGVKMLLHEVYPIPIAASLGVITGVLTVAIVASMVFPAKAAELSPVTQDPLGDEPDPVVAPIAGDADDED
jgi:tellurite resistance protein TerC